MSLWCRNLKTLQLASWSHREGTLTNDYLAFLGTINPLIFFLEDSLQEKLQVRTVHILLMLVLVGVGKVTLLLDWVTLAHRYWGLTHFGSSHLQHIVCGLPLILFTMSDRHLLLRLEHIWPCKGDNVKINLWETTDWWANGSEDSHFREKTRMECADDEIKSMAGFYQYLGYGWRAGGKDQEMTLSSLLGTTLRKSPSSQQGI